MILTREYLQEYLNHFDSTMEKLDVCAELLNVVIPQSDNYFNILDSMFRLNF